MESARTVIEGPRHNPDALTRRAAVWVRNGLIPPAVGADAERRMVAAVAIMGELHDKAGIRSRDLLRALFEQLTTGDDPFIDALLADALEGSPVCIVTYWGTADGRVCTSIFFRLTDNLGAPIPAPGDEWEPELEGVLSVAPLLDKILDSAVLPFRKREAH